MVEMTRLFCVFAVFSIHWYAASAAQAAKAIPIIPPAESDIVHKTYILGKDGRRALPRKYRRAAAGIGLLINRARKTSCTAFCVGPDVIATNAHCVFRRRYNEKVAGTETRHFVLISRGRWTRARVKTVNYPTDELSFFSGRFRQSRNIPFSEDWAFAKLNAPLCRNKTIRISDARPARLVNASRKGQVMMIGYHSGKWKNGPRFQTCRIDTTRTNRTVPINRKVLRNPRRVFLHTCDTKKGSSGSPILLQNKSGISAVAINSGMIRIQRRYMRGGRTVRSQTFRTNIAVAIGSMRDSIERFTREPLLRHGDDIRDVQIFLKSSGYYTSEIDGLFGPANTASDRHAGAQVEVAKVGYSD